MLALGCDHGGYELMQEVKAHLTKRGFEFKDFGCYSTDSVDYPEYAKKVAGAVAAGECELGILICGTGIGISLAANKVKGIRAAVCSEPVSARLTKQHNNANIICFGARIVGIELAKEIVDAYLDAEFEGGRHQTRVDMIMDIENE
jgi:ribose 5-phosphate isomerase B